jgi:DtxR family Mn-dependent transcriptional regulator
MISLTEENYLKALFHLSVDHGEVNVNDLSKHLAIKMPTVTSMMKKLAAKDFVDYESYKPLKLTTKGRLAAALIIRKHRLTEMYLVEKMGFGWEEVHEIAEQMEHIHAPKLFARMDETLGFPAFDPHGSPIPDVNGKIAGVEYQKLSTFKAGQTVMLSAVLNTSEDFLKYLNKQKLSLGDSLYIVDKEEFDGSITISDINHQHIVLSALVCERLLVIEQNA